MNLTSPKSGLVFRGVNRLLPALFVAGILAAGSYVVMRVESPAAADSDAVADADVGESSDTGNAELTEVTLTPVKFSYAGIQTETAGLRTIEDVRTVSGRLTYDEARHIELRSPVDGVLADVLVKPGDAVAEGQLLAVINSPEVGRARSSVLTAGAAREVVQQRVKRAEEIRGNLGSLFAMLDRKASVEEIERQFSNRSLGSYREDIVAAYSELQLADQLTAAAAPLTETGSLPLRTLRERHNDRHVANARFQSVWETTEFDVQLQKQQLAAEDAAAQRELMIAENQLSTLLGYAEQETAADSDSLSKLQVRAPFAGTIESRAFARQERIRQSETLLVLANTESLYVSASIRENEWAAISVKTGQEVTVVVPALPDRTFTAKVHYIGREVAVESHAVPLVATISNSEGLLRPGMYVRVSIPVGVSGEVLAVPTESVVQHENVQFVFVSDGDYRFRRVDVSTGVANDDWVEIHGDIRPGDRVAADGAFVLKSELLLSSEEE